MSETLHALISDDQSHEDKLQTAIDGERLEKTIMSLLDSLQNFDSGFSAPFLNIQRRGNGIFEVEIVVRFSNQKEI